MCGIAGFVGINDEPLLRSMCASLAHRGPDDEGIYVAPGIGLGMRRLAVIDLETGGQPIANESRDVWVVFNGEIYNYEELRRDLLEKGHHFSTSSDTETLVHLYEEHGVEFVHHLRGMFAVALWDAPRRRLVLARDRVGEKPMYYTVGDGWLLFGSEIKALLRAPVARQPDPQAVCDFLALGYLPGSRTAFAGIRKLPPAHRLVYEKSQVTVDRYWHRTRPAAPAPSFKTAAARLREMLDETVRLCLKSDVEVGAFLSGGVDSSLLVALMRRHSARVQTFTVGYEGAAAGFNELAPARQVATHLGTEHHELILGAGSSLDLLPRVLAHYDEPHGEPTSVLVYQLSEFARRRVKVAVGGTGGDEIFFGYPRHRAIRMLGYYQRLPRPLRRHLVERVVARWPESTTGSRFAKRVKRFVRGSNESPADAYLGWVRLLDKELHRRVVAEQVRASAVDPSGDAFLRDHLLGGGDRDLLDRAADVDVDGYLPEYQLTYVDRMSMAHGLEVRSPLCDFQLVDSVTALPAAYRLKGARSKHLLKTVAAEWIPTEIVNRPKVGFDSPIGQWFKDELRLFLTTFLSREHISRTGLLDPDVVDDMIRNHLGGRHDYSLPLWSVLALEAWYRMYIEDGGVGNPRDCRLADLRGGRAPIQRTETNGGR
jgi:asparagine synthase (glutamine-hydrolysing)